MVHYAPFHSVMSYGLIFWGNSTDSKCAFKLQKRAIRIIVGLGIMTHVEGSLTSHPIHILSAYVGS